jgi:hypothetical protein
MPSLESVAINFSVSENGHSYLDDFGNIRDALCGIQSTVLRHVTVSATMPNWDLPVQEAWVS